MTFATPVRQSGQNLQLQSPADRHFHALDWNGCPKGPAGLGQVVNIGTLVGDECELITQKRVALLDHGHGGYIRQAD